ncbi:Uncharacterized protein OBRU01_24123 [Operophtera brumata]|uniref:Myrosinase 1 n=1 Tax=Operophtera brumata TaxID=104452 RepID=A0A0L7KMK9_OPEBR|nr:Uncharacterized protein OBRU01_24123 [Operophtera brumata]
MPGEKTMPKNVLLFCYLAITQNPVSCTTKIRRFPEGFMFGASSGAYQVEGGYAEGVDDGSTGDVAADSYHQYQRDVELMKELGLDFYRFSVSWTRILPRGFADSINQAGISYYNNLIDELVRNNIKPFLTIYHWDMPWNLQVLGGWTNPFVVQLFTDYAKVLFDKFGDRVKYWVTVNDPRKACSDEFNADIKAPEANNTGIAVYLCAKNILLAHAQAYHLYDEKYRKLQNGTIGIAINQNWYEPASDTIDDYQAAADARQFEVSIPNLCNI